ncbi:MAG: ornithine carbamoyltransferase [Candidatus Omnitrophica bacterium]|nr:ornithine carbamoyltransferase [Candidatus Omnitrophota bacterium]
MKKDLISIKDLTPKEINALFSLADRLKKAKSMQPLKGKCLGLIFQKPSNRTRVSFEVGIAQLGGRAIYLRPEDVKLGSREPAKDVARTLSRYLDGIVARTFKHNDLLELAGFASVPVINALSDLLHPCQALSDLYTIRKKLKKLKGAKVAYIGDGNNVANSLLYGCSKMGVNLSIASPKGYEPSREILSESLEFASKNGSEISLISDASRAVSGADIVYTDVWTSMGQETQAGKRRQDFKNFQVNAKLLFHAKPKALVMHCLPAHRGEEISEGVLEGPRSIVFDQAENRLHMQKAILVKLLSKMK